MLYNDASETSTENNNKKKWYEAIASISATTKTCDGVTLFKTWTSRFCINVQKDYVDPFFLLTYTTHLIRIKVASTALRMLPFIKTRSISAWMHKFCSHMWYRQRLYSYKILYVYIGKPPCHISLSKAKSSSPPMSLPHVFTLFTTVISHIYKHFFSPSELRAAWFNHPTRCKCPQSMFPTENSTYRFTVNAYI